MHLSMNIDARTIVDLKAQVEKAIAVLEASSIGNHFSFNLNANTIHEMAYGHNLGQVRAEYEAKAAAILEEVKAEKVEAPKKEKVKKEKPTTEVVETTVTKTEEKELTKEDIQNACQAVSESKGIEAAKAVLASFTSIDGKPCRRISDVLVSDYAAFIEKCKA